MIEELHQGDILKIEQIKHPVLIISKDYFNTSGEIIGCPVFEKSVEGPLHIFISTDELEGFVQCEKLALLDLTIRGYKKISTLKLTDRINIVDAVQGIFDYM